MALAIANLAGRWDELTSMAKAKHFLGEEFLTWLWFSAESWTFPVAVDSKQVEFWIADRLIFHSRHSDQEKFALSGASPSQSPEAAVGLRDGRVVKELRIGIRLDEAVEYHATLRAQDLAARSLRMQSVSEGDAGNPADTVLENRVSRIAEFFKVLDSLFMLFLNERLSKDAHVRLKSRLTKWKQERSSGSTMIH